MLSHICQGFSGCVLDLQPFVLMPLFIFEMLVVFIHHRGPLQWKCTWEQTTKTQLQGLERQFKKLRAHITSVENSVWFLAPMLRSSQVLQVPGDLTSSGL